MKNKTGSLQWKNFIFLFFAGCINAVGGLLFFGVSMTLLRDLCVYLRDKETIQEDSTHGHERHE